MLSSWSQVLSLAILTFNVIHIVAGSIESGIGQLIGDLEDDFDSFEKDVESELEHALGERNGTLAQFTMGYQKYATKPIASTMETSLMVNTEHHLSALILEPLALKPMSRSDSTVKAARTAPTPLSLRPLTLRTRPTLAGTKAGSGSHWTTFQLCSRSTST